MGMQPNNHPHSLKSNVEFAENVNEHRTAHNSDSKMYRRWQTLPDDCTVGVNDAVDVLVQVKVHFVLDVLDVLGTQHNNDVMHHTTRTRTHILAHAHTHTPAHRFAPGDDGHGRSADGFRNSRLPRHELQHALACDSQQTTIVRTTSDAVLRVQGVIKRDFHPQKPNIVKKRERGWRQTERMKHALENDSNEAAHA